MSRILKKKTQLAAKYVVRKEVAMCHMQLKIPRTERISSLSFPAKQSMLIFMCNGHFCGLLMNSILTFSIKFS